MRGSEITVVRTRIPGIAPEERRGSSFASGGTAAARQVRAPAWFGIVSRRRGDTRRPRDARRATDRQLALSQPSLGILLEIAVS